MEEVGLREVSVESEIISKNEQEMKNLEKLASVSSGEYIAHDTLINERLV